MIYASNKKAHFNYEILSKYEAGIELKGTEVKSIKAQNVSIKESYIRIIKDEVYIVQMNISPYDKGNINNVDSQRLRKLLLHRKEIKLLSKEVKENKLALVALSVYSKNNKIKLEIALARGKKLYDKRQTIKDRDTKRQIEKNLKRFK